MAHGVLAGSRKRLELRCAHFFHRVSMVGLKLKYCQESMRERICLFGIDIQMGATYRRVQKFTGQTIVVHVVFNTASGLTLQDRSQMS